MKETDKIHEEYTRKIEAIHDELARVLDCFDTQYTFEDDHDYVYTLDDVYDVAVWVQNRLAELIN